MRTGVAVAVAGLAGAAVRASSAAPSDGVRPPSPGWLPAVRSAFLDGYRSAAPSTGAAGHAADVLMGVLELDKALYEAVYEARNRPDWLRIPLSGIRHVLRAKSPAEQSPHGTV